MFLTRLLAAVGPLVLGVTALTAPAQAAPTDPAAVPPQSVITALTFNLAGAVAKPMPAGRIHPFTDAVADHARAVGANVIGLQEVCAAQAQAIVSDLGSGYRMYFTTATSPSSCDDYLSAAQKRKYQRRAGTAIIVKSPTIADAKVTQLRWKSDPPGAPGRQPRQLTCLTANIGGPVTVCNTHLSPSLGGTLAIRQQITVVAAELNRYATGRLLFTCDCNTNAARTDQPGQFARLSAGLLNPDLNHIGRKGHGNGPTIDHVLAGPNAQVRSPTTYDVDTPSDHAFVQATLVV
jgi:endonuclease/exonuclease/phosphatase family metal-dependent hydrolase